MKELVEKLIAGLKRDQDYSLDPSYSGKQLLHIVYYRGWQFARGLWMKLWISSSGAVFVGRGVIVQHGYQVRTGKSLILEEGVYINALSERGVSLGNNVTIAKYAILTCTGVIAEKGIGISIGNHSAIGAQSFLAGQGGIEIGSDVIMGPQVRIFSENHNYADTMQPIRKQGQTRKGVSIGNNCWIGAGVTILDGVSIGDGCVIAAGSLVTKSIPENSVAMGVPATIVKQRSGQ